MHAVTLAPFSTELFQKKTQKKSMISMQWHSSSCTLGKQVLNNNLGKDTAQVFQITIGITVQPVMKGRLH